MLELLPIVWYFSDFLRVHRITRLRLLQCVWVAETCGMCVCVRLVSMLATVGHTTCTTCFRFTLCLVGECVYVFSSLSVSVSLCYFVFFFRVQYTGWFGIGTCFHRAFPLSSSFAGVSPSLILYYIMPHVEAFSLYTVVTADLLLLLMPVAVHFIDTFVLAL